MSKTKVDEFGIGVEPEGAKNEVIAKTQKETTGPQNYSPTPSKGGAPLKFPDLARVEALARKGMRIAAIARLVQMDPRTLSARFVDTPEVQEAIERGWATREKELLDDMKEHSKKNVVGAIFSLKQSHLGGWDDRREIQAPVQITTSRTVLRDGVPVLVEGNHRPIED